MNAKEEVMYRCTICNKVSADKDVAEKCCQPGKCRVCGKELKPYYTLCDLCKRKEYYDKANKIKYSDYKLEYLYDEIYDKYFRDYEEMLEYYEENEAEKTLSWAWGCSEYSFKINIDNAIESAEENMYDDFDDIIDYEELVNFIKEWNDKQTAKAYLPDYKTVIILSE